MSEYNPSEIEKKWQQFWKENRTYSVKEDISKPKFYVLDMFPYPSGSGLHVGHPLGYIASDIYARYKRLLGYNVLHPMGYDSFGLPAEQYAIQTGQHPAVTTETNIKGGYDKAGNRVTGYRNQLDKLGFSFDWDRDLRTSDPKYYRWTQWIFKQIYNSWYNTIENKAQSIDTLIEEFEKRGNANVKAATDFEELFTHENWKSFSNQKKEEILLNYRLAYLSETWVNWCPELGTVLANDEVKDGFSERGGYPVVQKRMNQWSMRITAYADRLLSGLDRLDWTESIKEIQRNWIGKSEGATVKFEVEGYDEIIEVFTTRPDTIFGVSFLVLAPEHELVHKITSPSQKNKIVSYQKEAQLKSERDRISDVKQVTGEFTGAFAIHPFSGKKIPIWIGDYVLASYGTGAVMSVPCGDQRDWNFATHFDIDIPNVFENVDVSKSAYTDKNVNIVNSSFLNGFSIPRAIAAAILEIEKNKVGVKKIQYKLRDAVFSRQRYWGEPFPIYYKGETPYLYPGNNVIELPEVDKYLPTEDGNPPLARAEKHAWKSEILGDRMEYNTMPGWAGSSWYFLRYTDPHNEQVFASREKIDYWKNVDLYIGGAEHATGHLLYARFWTKILFDLGFISFDEPFQKLINQGMIQGNSALIYRDKKTGIFVSKNKIEGLDVSSLHVDINFLEGNKLDKVKFKSWREEFKNAKFIDEEDGSFVCAREIDKMSKSKYNVQNPDDLVEKYGADTLRCYEMFLGPLEQHKPWDVQGITGVYGFLKKVWKLFQLQAGESFSEDQPSKKEQKIIHSTIKKVQEDLDRYSFNTPVSALMICVNELTTIKCKNKEVLSNLCLLLSPYAPHIAAELWMHLGNNTTIATEKFPILREEYLIEEAHKYPISFNGKMRFLLELPLDLSKEEIETQVMNNPLAEKYLQGQTPKKIIIVPKKIVNIVL